MSAIAGLNPPRLPAPSRPGISPLDSSSSPPETMSALFNFHSFVTAVLLLICTCTFLKMHFPSLLVRRTGCVPSSRPSYPWRLALLVLDSPFYPIPAFEIRPLARLDSWDK
ncbi:hypothetical protein ABZP36_031386 [Zizania latifolia]